MFLRRCVWLAAVVAAVGATQVAADYARVTTTCTPGFSGGSCLCQRNATQEQKREWQTDRTRHFREYHPNSWPIFHGYPLVWAESRQPYSSDCCGQLPLMTMPPEFVDANYPVLVCVLLLAVGIPVLVADVVTRRLAGGKPISRGMRLGRCVLTGTVVGCFVAAIEFETSEANEWATPLRRWPPTNEYFGFMSRGDQIIRDAQRYRSTMCNGAIADPPADVRWPFRTALTLVAAASGFLLALPLFRPWRRSRVTTDTPAPRSPNGFRPEFIGAPPPAGVECR